MCTRGEVRREIRPRGEILREICAYGDVPGERVRRRGYLGRMCASVGIFESKPLHSEDAVPRKLPPEGWRL
jgi:hypothetical protein